MDEPFKELSALLNKALILIANELLLRNGRDVATWPSLIQSLVHCKELIVAALNFELTLLIYTGHCVFDDLADFEASIVLHFDGVRNSEFIFCLGFLFFHCCGV